MSSNNTLSFELDESRQVHHAGDHVRGEPELILTKDYPVWAVLLDEENGSDEEGGLCKYYLVEIPYLRTVNSSRQVRVLFGLR